MNFLKRTAFPLFLTLFCAGLCTAQTISEPRQEKLLNNLKILVWRDSNAPKVTIKLRVHNGAAFDPKDKMGTMALLSDILFPNLDDTKEFFAEDLGGSLDVVCNYDYIQLSATGTPDKIQTILDAFASAVTNPPITPENFALVRDKRLANVKELEKNPAYVADRAVAQRLFGDFPYGRSIDGTSASLVKIDRPDLLLARDRFLTADNATLAIAGNVDADAIYQSARRLFGAWEKADQKIPATFRQPDAPDTKMSRIEMPNLEQYFNRYSTNASPRNGKDYYSTKLFARILEKESCDRYKVLYEPHLLRGVLTVQQSTFYDSNANKIPSDLSGCKLIYWTDESTVVFPQISQSEFEQEKSVFSANLQSLSQSDLMNLWLDVDTFKLISVKDEIQKANAVTLANIMEISDNLRKQPIASVAVIKTTSN